jgi:ethanolamine ammonia-lyase small subunit
MSTALTKPLPTTARLSLGRAAPSIATRDHLQFQLDHALARDAVHTQLDTATLIQGLIARNLQPILLRSAVDSAHADRRAYLRRPDLGRKLHTDSIQALKPGAPALASETRDAATNPPGTRILFVLADGLSALAIERHALPVLDATLPLLPTSCFLLPPAIATNARVAIADEIAHHLHAALIILLIGERPGLSSPDSLGVYITWNPRPGITTDADRNCISNIRGPQGLSYTEAAHRIAHYVHEATRLKTTGIVLKDPTHIPALPK